MRITLARCLAILLCIFLINSNVLAQTSSAAQIIDPANVVLAQSAEGVIQCRIDTQAGRPEPGVLVTDGDGQARFHLFAEQLKELQGVSKKALKAKRNKAKQLNLKKKLDAQISEFKSSLKAMRKACRLNQISEEEAGLPSLIGPSSPDSPEHSIPPASMARSGDDPTCPPNRVPTVIEHPLPLVQYVASGTQVTFSAAADCADSQQWQRNFANIPGATQATFSFSVTSALSGTSYRAKFCNSSGCSFSGSAVVIVPLAPVIVAQPQAQSAAAGANVTFSVGAQGALPMSFQWRKNGANIPGATLSSYSFQAQNSDNGALFSAKVYNFYGQIFSSNAALSVTSGSSQAPAITSQPQNVTAAPGQQVSFSIQASGSAPLSYQWQQSADGQSFQDMPGAIQALLSVTAQANSFFRCRVSNSAGSVTSNTASLTVSSGGLPVITAQPQSTTKPVGSYAFFTIAAEGPGPLSYQWKKNGTNAAQGTSSTLMFIVAPGDQNARIKCHVTNSNGTVVSEEAILTIGSGAAAPTIVTQPQSLTVEPGATATFSVTAQGSAPLSYQWYKNWAAIPSATVSSYSLTAQQADNNAIFHVTISNGLGSVQSNPARLNVQAIAPTITTQPVDLTVLSGETAVFSVAASGTAPLSYQWQRYGTAWADIPNAQQATYSLVATPSDNYRSFRCVVTNSGGSVASNSARLTVGVLPRIVSQPYSQTKHVGTTATFQVSAFDAVSYQWQRNQIDLPGETSSTLSFQVGPEHQNTSYRCRVSNSFGEVVSNEAALTVLQTPAITLQPQSQSIPAGQQVTFTSQATGIPAPALQWYRGNNPISGATGSSYSFQVQAADSGATFKMIASSLAGSVTSNTAILTVLMLPSITQQPVDRVTYAGGLLYFSIQATGSAPLSYQWQMNGQNIAGATANYYSRAATMSDNGAQFRCIVSNSQGSVPSSSALLTVWPDLPEILQQPADQAVYRGETATFSVNLTPGYPATGLYFQWFYQNPGSTEWNTISGATSSSYSVVASTQSGAKDGTRFRVRIVRGYSTQYSESALLTVLVQPTAIITHPENQQAVFPPGVEEVSVSFSVAAEGTPTLYYNWQGTLTGYLSGSNCFSGTTCTGTISRSVATQANGKQIRARVSGPGGTVYSNYATLSVIVSPVILSTVADQTVNPGDTVYFSITAQNVSQWQWMKNGQDIAGATSHSYSFTAQAADNGSRYSVRVSNAAGSAVSNEALLTVRGGTLQATQNPRNLTVYEGEAATFNCEFDAPNLSYRWYTNGNLGPVSKRTLVYSRTSMAYNGTEVKCIAFNDTQFGVSEPATLTVHARPEGYILPAQQSFVEIPAVRMGGVAFDPIHHPGLVFAAVDPAGLAIYDYSNPDQIQLVGSLPLGGDLDKRGVAVAVEGDYAVVTEDAYNYCHVINVSDPAAPQLIASNHDCRGSSVAIKNGFAYISPFAWTGPDLRVIDLQDPLQTHELSMGGELRNPRLIEIGGETLLIGAHSSTTTVRIYKLNGLSEPQLLSTINSPNGYGFYGVSLYQHQGEIYAYSIHGRNRLFVHTITDPRNPVFVKDLVLPGDRAWGNIVDDLLVIPNQDSPHDFLMVSLANPADPQILGEALEGVSWDSDYLAQWSDGELLFAGPYGEHSLMQVMDFDNAPQVELRGAIEDPAFDRSTIAVEGNLVATGGGGDDLRFIEIQSDNSMLALSRLAVKPVDIELHGGLAYVATESDGFKIVDPALNPPAILGSLDVQAKELRLRQVGPRLYAFMATALGLQVADVTSATAPMMLGSAFPVGEPGAEAAAAIELYQNGAQLLAYLPAAEASASGAMIMKIFNVSSPSSISVLASWDYSDPTAGVSLITKLRVVNGRLITNRRGLEIMSLANPLSPAYLGRLTMSLADFDTDGSKIYMSAALSPYSTQLAIVDIADPSYPLVQHMPYGAYGHRGGSGIAVGAGFTLMSDMEGIVSLFSPNP